MFAKNPSATVTRAITVYGRPQDVERELREFSACQGHLLNIVVASTSSVASISCTGGFGYENEKANHKGRPSSRKLGRSRPRSPPAPASNKSKSYFIKAPPPPIA
ncbi:hypothetical protein ACLOJK_019268 [Asimina triloba]